MDSIVFPNLPTYVGTPSLAGLLSLAGTFLLPLVAALFMRSSWSAFRKGLVLLALAAVKAYVEAWLGALDSGTAFNFAGAAYSVVVQFALAVTAYLGILKGTSVQQAALAGGVVKGRVVEGAFRA